MRVSVRSYLMAGVATVAAGAIAFAPAVAPPPDVKVAPDGNSTTHLSKATVELLAAVQRMTPNVVTSAVPAPTMAIAASPAPLNTASDLILAAWNAALPWIDYGVDLADYVLSFIPYGYLIGDQVSIFYYSLIRPVANSFVVDLVAPVVNEPLNLAVWADGLITLGTVTVNSLINLGISEFNYFFGWLIPPIPPIPIAAEAATVELTAASLAAPIEAEPTDTVSAVGKHDTVTPDGPSADVATAETGTPVTETTTDVEADASVDNDATSDEEKNAGAKGTPTTKKTEEQAPASTSSSGNVEAQGEVRAAGNDATPNEKTGDEVKASQNDKPAAANVTKTTEARASSNDDAPAKDKHSKE
jgi:hypothetical protein